MVTLYPSRAQREDITGGRSARGGGLAAHERLQYHKAVGPKLYFDACCLSRPFDDSAIDRNRLEAEAVLTLLRQVEQKRAEFIASDVLALEIERTPDEEQRQIKEAWLTLATTCFMAAAGQDLRAEALLQLGFRPFDALHVACAEASGCDYLLTTDDRLLRTSRRNTQHLSVRVTSPLQYLSEAIAHADHGDDPE